MSERDTHFQGFAKHLYDEIQEYLYSYMEKDVELWQELSWSLNQITRLGGDPDKDISLLIAQHAYDLVKHTLLHTAHIDLDRLETDEHVGRIPDLTEQGE